MAWGLNHQPTLWYFVSGWCLASQISLEHLNVVTGLFWSRVEHCEAPIHIKQYYKSCLWQAEKTYEYIYQGEQQTLIHPSLDLSASHAYMWHNILRELNWYCQKQGHISLPFVNMKEKYTDTGNKVSISARSFIRTWPSPLDKGYLGLPWLRALPLQLEYHITVASTHVGKV